MPARSRGATPELYLAACPSSSCLRHRRIDGFANPVGLRENLRRFDAEKAASPMSMEGTRIAHFSADASGPKRILAGVPFNRRDSRRTDLTDA